MTHWRPHDSPPAGPEGLFVTSPRQDDLPLVDGVRHVVAPGLSVCQVLFAHTGL